MTRRSSARRVSSSSSTKSWRAIGTRDRRVDRIAVLRGRTCSRWPLIWIGVVVWIGSRLYPSLVAHPRVGGTRHATPSHSAHERELARAVFPPASAGVRHRNHRHRGVSSAAVTGLRSRSSASPRSATSRPRCGSRSSLARRSWSSIAAGGCRRPLACVVDGRARWRGRSPPVRCASAATTMDPLWIEALGGREFHFRQRVAALGVDGEPRPARRRCGWRTVRRVRRGTATARDRRARLGRDGARRALSDDAAGGLAHVALAVQFQFSRVFWIVDLLVAIYGIAAIGESLRRRQHGDARRWSCSRRPSHVAPTSCGASTRSARSSRCRCPTSPWIDAMRWIARQPLDTPRPGRSRPRVQVRRQRPRRRRPRRAPRGRQGLRRSRCTRAPLPQRVVERRKALADFRGADGRRPRVRSRRDTT